LKKKLWSLQNLHAELRNKDNGKSPEIALFVKKASDDIQILLDSIDRPNEEIFPPNFILVRKILKTTKTYKDKYNGGSEEPTETTSQVEEGFETKSQVNHQDVPTLESLQFNEIPEDATHRSSKKIHMSKSYKSKYIKTEPEYNHSSGSSSISSSTKYIKLEPSDGILKLLFKFIMKFTIICL
jgi:hypothetical protein